jgi:low affinity Fe/Cu permease
VATGRRGSGAQQRVSEHPGSRLLHALDGWAANPTVALVIVLADAAWVLCSVVFGFPGRWETIFQTMVAAITMAMVFVIRHTQGREQEATQRKLDEILRALPGADNAMMTLEEAHDDDLHAATRDHREARDEAIAGLGS